MTIELIQWQPVIVRGEAFFTVVAGHERSARELLTRFPEALADADANESSSHDALMLRLSEAPLNELRACADALAPHVAAARFLCVVDDDVHAFTLDGTCVVERVHATWPTYLCDQAASDGAYDLLLARGSGLTPVSDSSGGVTPGTDLSPYEAALADAELAVKLFPNRPAAHVSCAWISNELGRPADAIAHGERALAADGDGSAMNRSVMLSTLSFARAALGEHTAARDAAREAERLMPTPLNRRNLAVCLMYTGAFEEAATLLERSNRARHLIETAAPLAHLGQTALATALLRVGLSLDPSLVDERPANWYPQRPDFTWAEEGERRVILDAAIAARSTKNEGRDNG